MARTSQPAPVPNELPAITADDVYDFLGQMLPEPLAGHTIGQLQFLLETVSVSTDFGGGNIDTDGLGELGNELGDTGLEEGLGLGDEELGNELGDTEELGNELGDMGDLGLGDEGLGDTEGLGNELDGGEFGDLNEPEPAPAPAARGGRAVPAKPAAAPAAPEFYKGQPVMAEWTDGNMYPATIAVLDLNKGKARVTWEDNSPPSVLNLDQIEPDDVEGEAPAAAPPPAPAPAARGGRAAPAPAPAPATPANAFTFAVALGTSPSTEDTINRRFNEFAAGYKTAKALKEYALANFGVTLKGTDKDRLADEVAQMDLTMAKLNKLALPKLEAIAKKYGVAIDFKRSRSEASKVSTAAKTLVAAALDNFPAYES